MPTQLEAKGNLTANAGVTTAKVSEEWLAVIAWARLATARQLAEQSVAWCKGNVEHAKELVRIIGLELGEEASREKLKEAAFWVGFYERAGPEAVMPAVG